MKAAFLISSLLMLSQAQANPSAVGREIFVHTRENHCDVSFTKQQRLAIRDLLSRAEVECGPDLVPIQLGDTKIVESHSCHRYQLGVTAEARFRCDVLSPEETSEQ